MKIDIDALFAAAPSPFVMMDRNLRIVWMNDAYLEVTGRTRDGLTGQKITDAFPATPGSTSDQMLRGSFQRVLDTGRIDHLALIPYPIENADSTVEDRFWSATHTPLPDAEGNVEYILQNTMDVTDLYRDGGSRGDKVDLSRAMVMQRAEAVSQENLQLTQMTQFLNSVFDQAPSFMAILMGPEHEFSFVNQAYIDITGNGDVLGKTVRDVLPELEGQGLFGMLDEVYATGEPISQRNRPVQLIRDGERVQIYTNFTYHPLRDDRGRVSGIFVQGHDVTGQTLAEAELAATRDRFRIMAETMPNHVWTATPDGLIDWVNDQVYSYTGADEGSLFGPDWIKVVHPEDVDRATEIWAKAIAKGGGYETEFRIRRADGQWRWHLVRARPIKAPDGEIVSWVGTNTDIEDRKTTEDRIARLNATLEERVAVRNRELEQLNETLRQTQKMEAIGGLAGGIAHDFNNLLQTISSNLQIAKREIGDQSPVHQRIDHAMKSVMSAATLASQLLSFSRRQPLAPKVLNLRELLQDSEEIIGSALGGGVEMETILDEDLWNTAVDPSNFGNAVLNLAINARDAMQGQGTLTIRARNKVITAQEARSHADARAGEFVVLSLSDTGSGMEPEVVDKIFEPFFTTKPDGRGTGLGMSMVYGFVKQSGGHITVESAPDVGTSIHIYLPRSTEEINFSPARQETLQAEGHETILLVEDDDDVRMSTSGLLRDLGYELLEAQDAEAAIEILRSDASIDLLFTDVIMPGSLTSRELAREAKTLRPEMPILFMSGYTQNFFVQDGRLEEGVELIGKPFTQNSVSQKIRELLNRRPAEPGGASGGGGDAAPAKQDAPARTTLEGLRLLVCEDDVLIRMNLVECLLDEGCDVSEAGNASEALNQLGDGSVDMLITDIGLPDMKGDELARKARQMHSDLPVIFATGDGHVAVANDLPDCVVLTKPFGDHDLLRAVSRLAGVDE